MKNTFRNTSVLLMATIVMFLSIGMNISKMKCAEDGALYFGTEVPSCSIESEVLCEKNEEKVSCCMIEVEKSCCPETEDNSCASETENIQFDFETTVSITDFDFSLLTLPLFHTAFSSVFSANEKANNYLSGIPPPKLNKPLLANIQSFLL